jgi:hypothetical protein
MLVLSCRPHTYINRCKYRYLGRTATQAGWFPTEDSSNFIPFWVCCAKHNGSVFVHYYYDYHNYNYDDNDYHA